jgi:hypothetical protein
MGSTRVWDVRGRYWKWSMKETLKSRLMVIVQDLDNELLYVKFLCDSNSLESHTTRIGSIDNTGAKANG